MHKLFEKPLIGSFDRQWEDSLKWGEAKELWNIKAFLKLKILQIEGGKYSKYTWPLIHYLHLKTQKIISTGPENQSGSLVLLTAPESDTTVSHQFHHATSRIFRSSGQGSQLFTKPNAEERTDFFGPWFHF